MNTFKTGLFKTKYHPTVGQFTLSPNIYSDVYISGFVKHFITLNLQYFYNDIKKSDYVGEFIQNVFKNIGLSEGEREIYTQLLANEEARKNGMLMAGTC